MVPSTSWPNALLENADETTINDNTIVQSTPDTLISRLVQQFRVFMYSIKQKLT